MKAQTIALFALAVAAGSAVARTPVAARDLTQRGSLVKSECIANRNPFEQDACKPAAVKGSRACEVIVDKSSGRLQFASAEKSVSTRLDDSAYEYSGKYAKYNLERRGLTTGMIEIRGNIHVTEIYINHDSSGNTYTRLRCK